MHSDYKKNDSTNVSGNATFIAYAQKPPVNACVKIAWRLAYGIQYDIQWWANVQ